MSNAPSMPDAYRPAVQRCNADPPCRSLCTDGRTDGLTENLRILRNAMIHSVPRTRVRASIDLAGVRARPHRPAPAARRDAAGRPHPNGQPVHPPPELLADVRKRLAEASSRARRSPSAGGAFQALRQATPDVPATTEPTQEPA